MLLVHTNLELLYLPGGLSEYISLLVLCLPGRLSLRNVLLYL